MGTFEELLDDYYLISRDDYPILFDTFQKLDLISREHSYLEWDCLPPETPGYEAFEFCFGEYWI